MMYRFTLLLLCSFLLASATLGQNTAKKPPAPFRVVGYFSLNAALRDTGYKDSAYVFLDKITHLNIAFINPDSAGNFRQDLSIDTLIKKAHKKNVSVLASIAGGGPHPYYSALLRDSVRKTMVDNLVALVRRYDLDGVDVDLEGSDIDNHYESFVTELAAALKPFKKLLTAAIATAYKEQLSNKALQQFDFINIMSYDRRGPWRPTEPGDHSPYAMAVEDLDYWHRVRSIPKVKLGLGLPFYGYGFGASDSTVVSMNYKQIVAFYLDAGLPNTQSDTLSLPGKVVMYYNNVSTIIKKTTLAMKNAGGVMIWQLLGDTVDENSLLNTIYRVVHRRPEITTRKMQKLFKRLQLPALSKAQKKVSDERSFTFSEK